MRYNLDVNTIENVEVKGWVGMRKSGQDRGWLQDGQVRLTRPGVWVDFFANLEIEPYDQANFIKQHLDEGHLIFDIEIEIAVKKEKFKVERMEVQLNEDMKTIFNSENSQTDFILVCEGQVFANVVGGMAGSSKAAGAILFQENL